MDRLRISNVTIILTLGLALASVASAQQGETLGFEDALARYKECIERIPFRFHTEGRSKLAATREASALKLLQSDYAKTKSYKDYTRYTISELVGRNFKTEEYTGAISALRKKHNKPVDTWLWVRTLTNEIDQKGDEGALAIARESKKTHLRAAAIAALGASANGNMKSAIVANCVEFPKKTADRMLLLGAMTGALYSKKRRVNDEDYRAALKAYISLLSEDVKLPHAAKVQMARHLQEILGGPAKFTNPEPWLELLSRGEVKKPKGYGTSAAPRFFGIETEGERFCYVIDMSDSMLKPISPSARPKGPITGPRKKKKSKSMVLDESDLPWHDIVTRWDLAREQLRISLSRLPSDKYFCVVWFGKDAGTLDASKGLIKASSSNIKKVMAELDDIESAPNKDGKEALRGDTALHSGLRVAFSLGKRGPTKEPVYVGPKALTEGCDTIFLLSDGAPTWDSFAVKDKNYGEGQTYRDVEAGIKAPPTADLIYPGPYSAFPNLTGSGRRPQVIDCWMTRDLQRMNAFRRITIHCVGLGEANEALLNSLAKLGNGQVFIVGKKK